VEEFMSIGISPQMQAMNLLGFLPADFRRLGMW
jgi:hypothetical protein